MRIRTPVYRPRRPATPHHLPPEELSHHREDQCHERHCQGHNRLSLKIPRPSSEAAGWTMAHLRACRDDSPAGRSSVLAGLALAHDWPRGAALRTPRSDSGHSSLMLPGVCEHHNPKGGNSLLDTPWAENLCPRTLLSRSLEAMGAEIAGARRRKRDPGCPGESTQVGSGRRWNETIRRNPASCPALGGGHGPQRRGHGRLREGARHPSGAPPRKHDRLGQGGSERARRGHARSRSLVFGARWGCKSASRARGLRTGTASSAPITRTASRTTSTASCSTRSGTVRHGIDGHQAGGSVTDREGDGNVPAGNLHRPRR